MSADLPQCAVPTSIHCDHLIQAFEGASKDLEVCVKTPYYYSLVADEQIAITRY
jgi:hypothetical protein